MRICCTGCIHGNLPNLNQKDFDILLVSGDIVPTNCHSINKGAIWLNTKFKRWIQKFKYKSILSGNHDFVFEKGKHLVDDEIMDCYLEDSGTIINGLNIFGSPYQIRYFNWAFNLDEPDLKKKWELIPNNTDILLLHGPPYGYGDWSIYDKVHTGSPSLTKRIYEINPKLVVNSHIHSGYGVHEMENCTINVNCSHVNEQYIPVNKPIIIEI